MKPIKENIQSDLLHSFRVNYAKLPFLDSPWHFHSDFELFYNIKGNGKRFVGDSIENFYEGDMVLIGANLPHVWKNGKEYYQENPNYRAEAIVVQFKEDSFGDSFFQIPEMQSIKSLLENSKRGLRILGETHTHISSELYKLVNLEGVARFNKLIYVLDILSRSKELMPLATKSFERCIRADRADSINKVFEYVANSFRKDIQLIEVARVASMSKTAFCRFFKKRTSKTFFQYLNEVRVNYACKLLIEDRLSIAEISYECGFNSPSYFIRQFKNIKKQTPKGFIMTYKRNFVI